MIICPAAEKIILLLPESVIDFRIIKPVFTDAKPEFQHSCIHNNSGITIKGEMFDLYQIHSDSLAIFLHSIVFMNGLDSDQDERESKYGMSSFHQFTNYELADTGIDFEIYER